MNYDKLQRDVSKALAKEPLKQVLPPGTPRRWEPEGGVQRHNERIHRESKYADTHKDLPFTFRKPPKAKGRNTYVQCDNCGYITSGSTATVGMICPECNKYSSVTEVVDDR
jgi:hypothetical protein